MLCYKSTLLIVVFGFVRESETQNYTHEASEMNSVHLKKTAESSTASTTSSGSAGK